MTRQIYENDSLIQKIKIETDGEHLIFHRRNISGGSKVQIKLSDIEKISANKNLFSYSLKIEGRFDSPVILGGMDHSAVKELKAGLGSLVEIKAAGENKTITLQEAREGAKKILGGISGDFDVRHIISYLITQSIQLDSSDIHFTPGKNRVKVHYRIDGLLQESASMEINVYERLLAALKNRAKLPSYKKSTPQDGSFRFEEGDLNLDVRLASIPAMFGEKVVLRILNTAKTPLFLSDLGFSPQILSQYKEMLTEPQGCIILTGPAGSGKTTTIFASLIDLYNAYEGTISIASIEDPVEYLIEEFQQTQVNSGVNLTFPVGLKSLLRLDPDIILVGEIRDPETAQTAVRTALTGHLIFTTVHSRDSLGVFPRLVEMGIKPGMASAAVSGVLYQRLIRKLCSRCKKEAEPPSLLIKEMKNRNKQDFAYFTSKGCSACAGTGYSGRTGVFELLQMNKTLRDMMAEEKSQGELSAYCHDRGMKFLRDDALDKIAAGVTDYNEAMRVCPRGELIS